MAKTGGGDEECAHDSHLTRAVDARHAARSYEAGLEPCVNAISTRTPPTAGSPARARRRSRATGPLAATHGRVRRADPTDSEAPAPVVDYHADQQPVDALDLDDARARYAASGTDLTDGLVRTYEIAIEVNGEIVPTNGGLLLFGHEPQKIHPDAVCLCARFRGVRKGTDILDQEEIRTGSMLAILDRMDAFIERNNPTASVVRGRRRDNIRHYDPLVIREALNNAVAHADYSVDGAKFHVHIFDDRLVIESPGPWVTGIDVEEVRAGHSRTRNRGITRNLHELDLIEERGSFWGKAPEAHEERGYPLPTWEDIGHSLRIILPVHPAAVGGPAPAGAERASDRPVRRRLTRDQRYEQIREALAGAESSTGTLSTAIGLGERQVQRLLREMEQHGTVVSNGEPDNSPALRWPLPATPS